MVRSQWKGLLIAGVAAAAIFLPISEYRTSDVIAYNNNVLMVRRSSAQILPNLDSEVLINVLNKNVNDPGEADDAVPSAATNTVSGSQVSTSSASGSFSSLKTGPSMATQIVTQGDLGTKQEAILGGAKVTMLNSQTNQQILSCIIETSQGKLIVIDGGFGADAAYLNSQILARGGHVSAWLLTHPHGDHVGAIYEILDNPNREITIDGIYYSLADIGWYSRLDPSEAEMAHALVNTFNQMPAEMLHGDIGKGYEIMVDDVKIEVLNNRYEASYDAGNNASMVYRITINGKTIIFLGDLGEEGGNRLTAEYGDGLKADIVQMAHHGQDGVGINVYQAINPSICLWPTPQWLWDNNRGSGMNTGSWKTSTTKAWMNQINESIIHYATKDGDQTIE